MLVNGVGHREESGGLATLARRVWTYFRRSFFPPPRPRSLPSPAPVSAVELQPLRRLRLTEGVAQTLFEEYAEHRRGPRGAEETGWVLLGTREQDEAVAVATLPAGTRRDAGVAPVPFASKGPDVA